MKTKKANNQIADKENKQVSEYKKAEQLISKTAEKS